MEAATRTRTLKNRYFQYIGEAETIFQQKGSQYGHSWLAFRLPSLVDQLMIKIRRIRTVQERGVQQVEDPIREEYLAIINYAVLALVRLHMTPEEEARFESETAPVTDLYRQYVREAYETMERKNHDYGEAWREMFEASFADMILAKLMRIKTMLGGRRSERPMRAIHDNLIDIINYAIFALIKHDGHA